MKMRVIFECEGWKDYCKSKGLRFAETRVPNTIISYFRKGMGLSDVPEDIKLHRPLPWNYFDM